MLLGAQGSKTPLHLVACPSPVQPKSRFPLLFGDFSRKVYFESQKFTFPSRNQGRLPQIECQSKILVGKVKNCENQGQRTASGRGKRARKANKREISRQNQGSRCFGVLQAAQPALLRVTCSRQNQSKSRFSLLFCHFTQKVLPESQNSHFSTRF